uniref:ORF6 protein n=1 Tax=Pika coronavirus TaxID=3027598 RepID=A0AAT9T6D6_9NIDO|nr:MAG: ORF6 protein [Pika coronavirus]
MFYLLFCIILPLCQGIVFVFPYKEGKDCVNYTDGSLLHMVIPTDPELDNVVWYTYFDLVASHNSDVNFHRSFMFSYQQPDVNSDRYDPEKFNPFLWSPTFNRSNFYSASLYGSLRVRANSYTLPAVFEAQVFKKDGDYYELLYLCCLAPPEPLPTYSSYFMPDLEHTTTKANLIYAFTSILLCTGLIVITLLFVRKRRRNVHPDGRDQELESVPTGEGTI